MNGATIGTEKQKEDSMHSAKAKEKEEKVQYNVMAAEALVIFEEIAQTRKAVKEEKGDNSDGKGPEKAKKEEGKVKAQCTAHVGIVEEHTMQESVQKERAKGLAKRAKYEVLKNNGPQRTLG